MKETIRQELIKLPSETLVDLHYESGVTARVMVYRDRNYGVLLSAYSVFNGRQIDRVGIITLPSHIINQGFVYHFSGLYDNFKQVTLFTVAVQDKLQSIRKLNHKDKVIITYKDGSKVLCMIVREIHGDTIVTNQRVIGKVHLERHHYFTDGTWVNAYPLFLTGLHANFAMVPAMQDAIDYEITIRPDPAVGQKWKLYKPGYSNHNRILTIQRIAHDGSIYWKEDRATQVRGDVLLYDLEWCYFTGEKENFEEVFKVEEVPVEPIQQWKYTIPDSMSFVTKNIAEQLKQLEEKKTMLKVKSVTLRNINPVAFDAMGFERIAILLGFANSGDSFYKKNDLTSGFVATPEKIKKMLEKAILDNNVEVRNFCTQNNLIKEITEYSDDPVAE